MKCPKCKEDIDNGATFCGICGHNLHGFVDDFEEEKPKEEKKSKKKKNTRIFRQKKNADANGKVQNGIIIKKRLRIAGVVAAFVLVISIIVYIISIFAVTEGERVLKNVPLGRNLEYVKKETDAEFVSISKSDYLSKLNNYNYVYESSKMVKIEGINLPEWAVTLIFSSDGLVQTITYYEFSALLHDWKGVKKDVDFSADVVKYGMSQKETERVVGFSPYTIIKGINNQTTYVFRYNIANSLSGDLEVFNLTVVFNDVDGTVKNAYSSKIDFGAQLLSAS